MKKLTISICVLFLLMTLALPASAEPELYFGDVSELADGSKVVSLMVGDVNNLGTCNVLIEYDPSKNVGVNEVTSSGDGNALKVSVSNIDNTKGYMMVYALDTEFAHSNDVVICNIKYNDDGSDSIPFVIHSGELTDHTTYKKIQHTGEDLDRSILTPTIVATKDKNGGGGSGGIPESTEIVDENFGLSDTNGDDGGGIPESTEIVDETNGSSGEDNDGIPGFGLLTGLSVMLIAVRLLREDK